MSILESVFICSATPLGSLMIGLYAATSLCSRGHRAPVDEQMERAMVSQVILL